ncbi:hypothetical protein Q7P35_009040 [Cladosporium inversicolor]
MCTFAKNLTIVLKKRGMFEKAELMMIQVIGDRIEQLGGVHPDTFTSANNLAMVLCNREYYYDAQMLLRSALAGSEREERHGREHPRTCVAVWWLAHLMGVLARESEATTLYQRAISGFRKSLGEDHPYTVSYRSRWTDVEASLCRDMADRTS